MAQSKKVIWTIKELTEVLRERQKNKYDANFSVSGARGDGKSTICFKLFNSFKKEGFRQKEHQVYSQDDVIKLLSNQQFGYCWDDEAINSGYKRDFQVAGQKKLIKIVTNYRDNFNIYGSALPFFTSLDKDLRALIFLHIHIIQRGAALLFMPLTSQIFGQDQWDITKNIKIEQQENKRVARNPNLPFRYWRFTTFAGYLYFGDMTDKQRKFYELIKKTKRGENFEDSDVSVVPDFYQKVYKSLIEKRLTQKMLMELCRMEGKKYSSTAATLNTMLRNNEIDGTLRNFLKRPETKVTQKVSSLPSKSNDEINKLIPDL